MKIGNNITESFQCHNGVKQGDILSPTLFNLYLHDLPEQFETVNDPVCLDGRAIDCLLYADDWIIVSQTAEGLQRSLSKLQEYCSLNSMTINSDKTKIVLYNKPGKKLSRYHFHINGEHIDMATTYKYLGLTFSVCGSFTTAKHELKKKNAIKAFFKIRKEMGASFKSNVQISLELFETLIKPILLYGSEVWGVDKFSFPGSSIFLLCTGDLGEAWHEKRAERRRQEENRELGPKVASNKFESSDSPDQARN